MHYKETHKKFKGPCTDAILTDKANLYLPQQQPVGAPSQKLLHFTFVFQIFVMMTLINEINSRKIELGEFNVFSRFFSNAMFIIVYILTWAMQISMVQIGGIVTKCAPLTLNQNLLCLGFGLLVLPWGVVVKLLPLKLF